MITIGAALLVACGLDTRYQLGFWTDSITLFKQVVKVTPTNNYIGYAYLGIAQQAAGEWSRPPTVMRYRCKPPRIS